jgi:hypothetical protein
MSPILGIYASQISGHLFAPSGAYDSIATTTVGAGGASSVTFSSIPSTYTHLQIRTNELNSSSIASDLKITFNSDTGSNYSQHLLWGNGTSPSAAGFTNQSYAVGAIMGSTTAPAASVVDILDYTNTNKYTTVRGLSGVDVNGAGGFVFFNSSAWLNTAAITSITLTAYAGTINQYSSFALYGIKGN